MTPYATEYGYIQDDSSGFFIDYEIADTVNLAYNVISREVVDEIHKHGCLSFVYIRVTNPETEDMWRFFYAIGVDIICTNYPAKLLKFREIHLP